VQTIPYFGVANSIDFPFTIEQLKFILHRAKTIFNEPNFPLEQEKYNGKALFSFYNLVSYSEFSGPSVRLER
jgi:hypothetical protein